MKGRIAVPANSFLSKGIMTNLLKRLCGLTSAILHEVKKEVLQDLIISFLAK